MAQKPQASSASTSLPESDPDTPALETNIDGHVEDLEALLGVCGNRLTLSTPDDASS